MHQVKFIPNKVLSENGASRVFCIKFSIAGNAATDAFEFSACSELDQSFVENCGGYVKPVGCF